MKLNLGCGRNRIAGFVNVDSSPVCEPDLVLDLEQLPWPWETSSVEEIRFIHSLEHMGQAPDLFIGIIKEVYRVSAPGARLVIHVPHPRHDDYLQDPTHVRPISAEMMCLFDRKLNDEWAAGGASNTPLAHYTGVNLRLTGAENELSEPYRTQLRNGEITQDDIWPLLRDRNNVVREIRMAFEVLK